MAKKSRTPVVDSTPAIDPADAFARADPEVLPPDPFVDPDVGNGLPEDEEKPKKRKGSGARSPVVVKDEDDIDPLDAAAEIVKVTDGLFMLCVQIRGYGAVSIKTEQGEVPLLPLVIPDEEAKARLRKALARLMKSAGATMSPGAALAFAAFGCYGGPILSLEMTKMSNKKKAPQ